MPVIVAANPKGGTGKSTSCLVLGTTLAHRGGTVRIIDADPQETIAAWSKGNSKFKDIVVKPEPGEELVNVIDRLRTEVQFVIIDLQGTANTAMVAAMSRANYVLIPMRAKTADARVATRAIGMLRSQENIFQRKIPHSILLVANSPQIATREEKEIRRQISTAALPLLSTSLNERTAFSHMFAQNLSLVELSATDTNGLDAALVNADAFTDEVLLNLRQSSQKEKVA